jgi:ATP-dependent Clp protease protease subunit
MNVQMKIDDRLYRTKKVFLFSEINDQIISEAMKTILSFPSSTKNIEVWIKNNGGDIYEGLALVDVLRTRKYIVKTVGVGYIYSMAVPILASGTPGYRYISPNAQIMVHEISWGGYGNRIEMKEMTKHADTTMDKYLSILTQTTKKKKKFWKEFIKAHDKYATAKDAIKFGLADNMGLPK